MPQAMTRASPLEKVGSVATKYSVANQAGVTVVRGWTDAEGYVEPLGHTGREAGCGCVAGAVG